MNCKQSKRFLSALDGVDDTYIEEGLYVRKNEGGNVMNKKMITVLVSVVVVVGVIVLGNHMMSNDKSENNMIGGNGTATIANPWVPYDTLEEVEKVAGYGIDVPSELNGLPFEKYRVLNDNEMISACFMKGEETYTVRKAKGDEDISGNYTSYDETEVVEMDGISIELQGNDGMVSLVNWTMDGYSYSLECSSKPLEKEEVSEIIKMIK